MAVQVMAAGRPAPNLGSLILSRVLHKALYPQDRTCELGG
jgi:hypothetical protein